jgi:hypothetical protein
MRQTTTVKQAAEASRKHLSRRLEQRQHNILQVASKL